MPRLEARVTPFIRRGVERVGWCYKIPDQYTNTRPVERPFDLIGCVDGRTIAIEVKALERCVDWSVRMLRDSQHRHLRRVQHCGGLALVALVRHVGYGDYRLLAWSYVATPALIPAAHFQFHQHTPLEGTGRNRYFPPEAFVPGIRDSHPQQPTMPDVTS